VAPKRIHTRSHPDPELVKVVDDSEKLIRKISLAESQGSSSPPPRETSLPENLSQYMIFSLIYHLRTIYSEPNLIASWMKPY